MSIVGAKVHPPSLRRRLVERSRLTERLGADGAHEARLILVAAPAGFGKTTTLTQWLAGLGPERKVAWLSLDTGDAELGRFVAHLVAAIQVQVPEAGVEALSLLDAGGGATTVQSVLVSLLNDLDVLAGPFVVALDDYHVIDEPAVHEAVTFLLDNVPPQVTLAMTTRADPPLPLSRLRARGQLVEVRAEDLRFTVHEAETFLNDVMGLGLVHPFVAALEARTEGWAAGLQLAGLSVRSQLDDPRGSEVIAEFVEDFSGSHRFVLDYLVEEVLDRQPDDVRDFLLTTSVLDQMTGELCDALTGRSDGQLSLETLERENLFVVPLDHSRRWYRYHHLFGDALRARLAARQPDRVRTLHATASRWFAEQGLLRESIAHAAASGDHERAAELVELGVAELRRRRENRTIRDWLAALPENVVRGRPVLALYMGWRLLSEGDIDGVEAWLAAAEAGVDTLTPPHGAPTGPLSDAYRDREDEMRSVPSMVAVYRASVAQARGDVARTIAQAARALELAGPQDHFPRGAAAGFLGMAAWAAGDVDDAVTTFAQAVDNLRSAGMVADELGATVVLADMWLAKGQPNEARRLLERSLASATRSDVVLPTVGDLHVGLARVLCEQCILDEAADHLEIARQLGELGSLPENRHRWHLAMSALLQASGDLDGAVGMLDRAEPLFLLGYFPDLRPVAALRARLWIRQNRLDAARAWAQERGVGPTDPLTYLAEFDHLTLARLLVAEGDARGALGLLDQVVDVSLKSGRGASVVEARMVRALAYSALGDLDAAVADLGAAIGAGVPNGYCRLFLDEGAPMIELLEAVVDTAAAEVSPLAERLLAAGQQQVPDVVVAPGAAIVEPLSDREVEVLRLLATELTGPQIASQLYVSVNTLRTHTKHIFTKLGVNTRRAAVRRAAELGLG